MMLTGTLIPFNPPWIVLRPCSVHWTGMTPGLSLNRSSWRLTNKGRKQLCYFFLQPALIAEILSIQKLIIVLVLFTKP